MKKILIETKSRKNNMCFVARNRIQDKFKINYTSVFVRQKSHFLGNVKTHTSTNKVFEKLLRFICQKLSDIQTNQTMLKTSFVQNFSFWASLQREGREQKRYLYNPIDCETTEERFMLLFSNLK